VDGWKSDSSEIPSKALEGYPPVRLAENCTREDDVLSPILRHVAEIQYTNENLERSRGGDIQTLKAWDDEDHSLSEVLLKLSASTSSEKVIDLGEIRLGDYEGRVVGLLVGAKFHLPNIEWLFVLPLLMIHGPSYDFTDSASNDLISACRILQDAGKISLDARLKIVLPTEPGGMDSPNFPLSFQLELIVSLALPRAMEYTMHKRAPKREIIAHEDAQRRLLRVAFGEDSIMSDEVAEPITVATFYNVMRPAPALPSDEAMRSMQPDGLLPTLLPFQCSSVAWLLEREGMSILPNGSIVPQSSPGPFSFWKEIQVGNHTLHFNLLSGDIIDEQTDFPVIHGGMLAEEPGLGKTLETIALILLNPAPPSWNPSLLSWDDIACLNVKAVKVFMLSSFELINHSTPFSVKFNHHPSLTCLSMDG
jgi:E3 ubiquitin-protein ligase SHPRH